MYIAYGLAIIRLDAANTSKRQNFWKKRQIGFRAKKTTLEQQMVNQRLEILNRFGLNLTTLESSTVDLHLDMMNRNELVIMSLDDGWEAWFGWSIATIQDQLLSVWELPLPIFDGTFFTLDYDNPTFSYQYIKNGRLGPGALVTQKKSWGRAFKSLSDSQVKYPAKDAAISAISSELMAEEELVSRVLGGMFGRGYYGMAYHAEKKEWVMAKSLSEAPYIPPETFQELNRNSYKKKGNPTSVCQHAESGLGFLSQSEVFEKMLQYIIFQTFGFRVNYVDRVPYDSQFATRECLRGSVEKLN